MGAGTSVVALAGRVSMPKVVCVTTVAAIAMTTSGAAATVLTGSTADSCSWRQVLSVPGGWFNDVTVARDLVWAVGYQTPRGSNKTYPLVATWDGRQWSTTVAKGYGKNEDVMTAPGGEVWVTGVRNKKPVLQRFDGRQWTTASREVTFANSQGPHAAWVGEGDELVRFGQRGQETRLGLPSAIDRSSLDGPPIFTADARGRVWVDDSEASRFHFWDGSRWASRRYPGDVYLLYAMATRSSNDAWAVGNELAHWDGRQWKEVLQGGEDQVLHDSISQPGDWSRLGRTGDN